MMRPEMGNSRVLAYDPHHLGHAGFHYADSVDLANALHE